MIRLLIVDDHVLFREGLAAIIRPNPDIEVAGFAGSVKEAVDVSRAVKPDITLMDFGLPDGTGAEATKEILAEFPESKIVFLTMSDDDEDLIEAVRSGARGYLLKNMHPQKLIAALRSVQQGESALSRSMTKRLMEEFARTREPVRALASTLTRREVDVLCELASGKSNQEIAESLVISENTVKYHVHSILDKLGLADRRDAAVYAREHGLTSTQKEND